MIKNFLLICSIGIMAGLEVLPEMPAIEYLNPKYVEFVKVNAGRQSRRSPYYVGMHVKTLTAFGNNLTTNASVYEYLSGRYHPTPLQAEYKLCDYLYNEPFLGQMLARQFPFNWTCPFPAGEYKVNKIVIHLEKFPYSIPILSTSLTVKTRVVTQGYLTGTGELIYKGSVYLTVNMKPTMRAKD